MESRKCNPYGTRDYRLPATPETNISVVICRSFQSAEKAVHTIREAHTNIPKLSIIGRDYFDLGQSASVSSPSGSHPVSEIMAFWGRVWPLLSGDAFIKIKGMGSIIVAGPLSKAMRQAGTNPAFFHAHRQLRTYMLAIGISGKRLIRYEAALRSNCLLIVLCGRPNEIEAAGNILKARTKLQGAEFVQIDKCKTGLIDHGLSQKDHVARKEEQ